MIYYIVSFIVLCTALIVGLLSNNITAHEIEKQKKENKTHDLAKKIIAEAKKSKADKNKQQ